MYKQIVAVACVLISITWMACGQSKKVTAKQPEVKYEFPVTMNEQVKAHYVQEFGKGEVLYNINCAKCHTSYVKKKEIIPDFTLEQLMSYEIRASNPKHEGSMSEVQVSTEELGYIITFLSYKKKNPVSAKK